MARSGRLRQGTATPAGAGPSRRREIRDVHHSSDPRLRIERVVVAPSGVHVVTEAATFLDEPGDALSRARAAASLVRALLPPRYRPSVRAVLCDRGEPDAGTSAGVLVTAPETFEHIVQCSPVVLSTSEVHQVHLRLGAMLTPFPSPAPPSRRAPWRGRLAVAVSVAVSAGIAVALWLPETAQRVPGW